eukprot:451805_1
MNQQSPNNPNTTAGMDMDENILIYIANYLKLYDIQILGKVCKLFHQISNNPNSICYLSFYQDILTTNQPFSNYKFNKIHHLMHDDNIDVLNINTIKQYWLVKANQTKDKFSEMWSMKTIQNNNNDVLKTCCIDQIETLHQNIIKNKLFNTHWQYSIQKLEISSLGSFFGNILMNYFPKQFDNLQLLKVKNIQNETLLIHKGFKTLITLDITLRIYGSSDYTSLFDSILNCKCLQYLKITGNGQKQLYEKCKNFNNDQRKLRHLRCIRVLRLDITPNICEFYKYLIVNTFSNELKLQFEPVLFLNNNEFNGNDIGNSIGNIFLSSQVNITKILSFSVNLFEEKCWEILNNLLDKLKKSNMYCIRNILFAFKYNECIKDGFLSILPNIMLDIITNHCCETFKVVINCREMNINDIGTFWKQFVLLMNNIQYESEKHKTLMKLNVKYNLNMWTSNISCIETLKCIAKLLNDELYNKNMVMDLIQQHLSKSFKIELDLSYYKEEYCVKFDALVNELNDSFGSQVMKRGQYGGHFIFTFI